MIRLEIDAVAHGGDGIGRHEGKAVFVRGAVPGDVVDVELTVEKKRFAKGDLIEVVDESPDRVVPPCPLFGVCGGCSWQQVPAEVQRRWKHETVAGQLGHIGGFDSVEVRETVAYGDPFGYRNRVDFRTRAGRPTLYAARSHDQVPIDSCLLLAEPLAGLLEHLGQVDVPGQLTLRAGIRTGDVVAICEGGAIGDLRERGVPAFEEDSARISEVVAGESFRISGRAFFQANTIGADALVSAVGEAAGPVAGAHVLDAYAGVGLFAATVGSGAGRMTVIEADWVAGDDLRANLGDSVDLIVEPVESALELVPGSPDIVIVDPPRTGLGEHVVAEIAGLRPGVVASVSCDPASFARDARMLTQAGYDLEWVQPIDLFPQTPHIETVARFVVR